MATVTNTIKLPGDVAPSHAAVEIELVASTTTPAAGWVTATDVTVLATYRPTVTAGAWSADLTPNANITPSGTVYRVTEYADRRRYVHYITVSSGGGSVFDLLTDEPAAIAPSGLAAHAASTAPHPGIYQAFAGQSGPPITRTALPGQLYNIKAQNAVPYSQDNVTTVGNYQYAVWVNSDRDPIVGQRIFPHGDWTTFDLSTIAGNPLAAPTEDDLHNNYSIGIDQNGRLHVVGNLHDVALRYVRSVNPHDITAWAAATMIGTQEDSATYPQFLMSPDDEFLFIYRNGSSGNGAIYINVYNATTNTWARRSKPLSGLTADGVSPDESPYINHPSFSDDGVLHFFGNWRTTNDVSTSHDIFHMQSADGGTTWTEADGSALTLPVTPSTCPVLKAGNAEIINQSGADVDSDGRPHGCFWLREAADGYLTRLVHFWWDGAAWQEDTEVTLPGVSTLYMARPSVFCVGDRTLVLYSAEQNYQRTTWWVKDISPSPAVRLNTFALFEGDLGAYEPSYDTRALNDRAELHLLITPIDPDGTGTEAPWTAQWGAVLSMDLSRIEEVAANRSASRLNQGPSTVWVPATSFLATSGTPTLSASSFGAPTYLLDASATEVVAAIVNIPEGWVTFDVEMWWTNVASSTGDVRMNVRQHFRGDGNNVTGGEVNLGNFTATAPAQNILEVTSITTGVLNQPGSLWKVNVRRVGGDAADTLANDIGFIGLRLTKAS